eukprot:1162021-Pelagomonas_calceolata.AAC.16
MCVRVCMCDRKEVETNLVCGASHQCSGLYKYHPGQCVLLHTFGWHDLAVAAAAAAGNVQRPGAGALQLCIQVGGDKWQHPRAGGLDLYMSVSGCTGKAAG